MVFGRIIWGINGGQKFAVHRLATLLWLYYYADSPVTCFRCPLNFWSVGQQTMSDGIIGDYVKSLSDDMIAGEGRTMGMVLEDM
jgi:hypothetical protein